MDEPFGALDAHTKIIMQEELATIFKTQLTTAVMVTHDVEEAIYLSDAILIMSGRPGRLIEVINVDLKKPRDRSDQRFVSLRFEILRRAFSRPAPVLGFLKRPLYRHKARKHHDVLPKSRATIASCWPLLRSSANPQASSRFRQDGNSRLASARSRGQVAWHWVAQRTPMGARHGPARRGQPYRSRHSDFLARRAAPLRWHQHIHEGTLCRKRTGRREV